MGKTYAVIGLGRFGASVAKTLIRKGFEVLALDVDECATRNIAESVTHVVQADATDLAALRAAGVRNCEVAVVGIGKLQPSILATLNVKELGIPYVVAKAVDAAHGKVLSRIGADRVVYPEREMGERIAHSLASRSLVDYIELTEGHSVCEVVAPQSFGGRTLRDLNLRVRYGVMIVVVRRGNDLIVSPGGDQTIQAGDILLAVGANEDLDRLEMLTNK